MATRWSRRRRRRRASPRWHTRGIDLEPRRKPSAKSRRRVVAAIVSPPVVRSIFGILGFSVRRASLSVDAPSTGFAVCTSVAAAAGC